jgi:hypothetical protein
MFGVECVMIVNTGKDKLILMHRLKSESRGWYA